MSTDAAKPKDPRTVTLKGVRFSFTDGIKDKKKTSDSPDAVPKHSWNIINETSGKYYAENNAKIVAALKAAGEKQWKNENAYKDIAEDNPKRVTFKKGEKFKNKEGKVYAGYEGHYAFGCSGPGGGQRRPIMKDKYKRPVEEKDILEVFYGGTYGDIIVSFYGTDKGSRGIFATGELIRSHQTGERMGGGYVFDEADLGEMDDMDDEGDAFDLSPEAKPTDDLLM